MTTWREIGDRVFVRRYPFYDQNIGVVLGGDDVMLIDTRSTHVQAREIADDLGVVGDIDAQQVGIVRREQVDDGEQRRLVAVVGRRVARVDTEHQRAAALGLLLGGSRRG